MFGYDKYNEVTREHNIRATYCDLAIKIDGKVQLLLEVKAVGLDLKDNHVRQAVDYAANQGIEWVGLTNGGNWRVYRVSFGKPIDHNLVLDLDLLTLNARSQQHLESLFLLTRESIVKSALVGYHDRLQATNRFCIASVVLTDPVLSVIRRELQRITPGVKVQTEEIRDTLMAEVLKRDVIEGEEAEKARKRAARASATMLRVKKEKGVTGESHSASAAVEGPATPASIDEA